MDDIIIFGDYSGKLLNLMIKYSNLNDFIFCPASIYFHKLYGSQDNLTYHAV